MAAVLFAAALFVKPGAASADACYGSNCRCGPAMYPFPFLLPYFAIFNYETYGLQDFLLSGTPFDPFAYPDPGPVTVPKVPCV